MKENFVVTGNLVGVKNGDLAGGSNRHCEFESAIVLA